ncbi:hypothetical protein LCGC14_0820480 [marine sediment metagenome]|uniref:Uncharacterized protein n=1 Tax=marine sediment metagenome TaxID=412755 RepID=A0A0F9PIZ2_9ZZZZ
MNEQDCRADECDDDDPRVPYLQRKLERLRKDPLANRWAILSVEKALEVLQEQAGPDPPLAA